MSDKLAHRLGNLVAAVAIIGVLVGSWLGSTWDLDIWALAAIGGAWGLLCYVVARALGRRIWRGHEGEDPPDVT